MTVNSSVRRNIGLGALFSLLLALLPFGPHVESARASAGTGTINIVSTGGTSEGTGWTFFLGKITTVDGNPASINASVVVAYLSGGDVLIESGVDVNFQSSVSYSSGNSLRIEAERHVRFESGAHISASGSSNLTVVANKVGGKSGIIFVDGANLSTNGGSILLQGNTVFQSSAAQSVTSSGGNITINGETVVSNSDPAGLTISSGGGDVVVGRLDSANQYTWVPKTSGGSWDHARSEARGSTDGRSAEGDSYLVTITSELENSIAALTAGYQGAWIGAHRPAHQPPGTGGAENGIWQWADGPEHGVHFFSENVAPGSSGGGTPVGGYYNNFSGNDSSGEPNGGDNDAEGVAQFFGAAGLWNDLTRLEPYSTSVSQYAVRGYVQETNLAVSKLTIDVGVGSMTKGATGEKGIDLVAPPKVSALTPSSELTSGGTQATISGERFSSATAVSIGSITLTKVSDNTAAESLAAGEWSYQSDGTILAKTALRSGVALTTGPQRVVVTNSQGSSGDAIDFTYEMYTVTYDDNEDQHQGGFVAGSVPSEQSAVSGSSVTVAGNSGSLVRQGFTFEGWSTSSSGSGFDYDPGDPLVVSSNTTLYAQWGIPQAARLFGSGGEAKVSTTGSPRGIATNGSSVFFVPSDSASGTVLRNVNFDGSVVADIPVTGTGTVAADVIGAVRAGNNDLAYSKGFVFARNAPIVGSTDPWVYAISPVSGAIQQVALPVGKPFLAGQAWLRGNIIDFPDGRIGAVSKNKQDLSGTEDVNDAPLVCPTGFQCKVLRLFTVNVSSENVVTLTHSEDILLADDDVRAGSGGSCWAGGAYLVSSGHYDGWPCDDHGIATDGTYLYQSHFARGYKAWALRSGEPSYVAFNGDGVNISLAAEPACGAATGVSGGLCPINGPYLAGANEFRIANATFFTRDHTNGRYLMSDHDGTSFLLTAAAVDLPVGGPGEVVDPPTTPGSFTLRPSDSQVVATWAASATVDPDATVSYTVTAEPGSHRCPTTSLRCEFTGLVNGTSYTFAISARWAGGSSGNASGVAVPGIPASGGSGGSGGSTSTPATPTFTPSTSVVPQRVIVPSQPTPTPRVLTGPVVSPGRGFDPSVGTRATVGGAPATVSSTPTSNSGVLVRTGSVQLGFNVAGVPGGGVSRNPGTNSPELTVPTGQSTRVSGGGLLPGSQMQVWLPSSNGSGAKELARIPVKSDGSFDSQLSFTANRADAPIAIGRQVMQVTGYDAQGNQTVVDMTINIAQGSPEPEPNRLVDALPKLGPGQSLATSAGVPEIVTIEARPEAQEVAVTSGEWAFNVSLPEDAGRVEQVAAGANITLTQSRSAAVSGEGFQPDTRVDVWLFSTPTLLGSMIVSADGSFSGEVYLDSRFAILGEHTLQLQGVAVDGFIKAANLGVVVQEPVVLSASGASALMTWVAVIVAVIAMLVVVTLLASRRRRRFAQGAFTGLIPVTR